MILNKIGDPGRTMTINNKVTTNGILHHPDQQRGNQNVDDCILLVVEENIVRAFFCTVLRNMFHNLYKLRLV